MPLGSLPNSPDIAAIVITGSSGSSYDITSLAPEIHIYEDVFANTLSAQIVIGDAAGVLDKLPIVGNEKIIITMKRGAHEPYLGLVFISYKVSNIRPLNQKVQVYTLECISQEYMQNVLTATSKAYSGSAEQIIESILKTELGSRKPFLAQKTSTTIDLISAYWNPFYTMNMIAARTLGADGKQPSYFLFEDYRQNFNFVSLESLFRLPKLLTWSYRDPNFSGSSNEDSDLYRMNTIMDFHVESAFDMIEGVMDGLLGGTLIEKDVLSKGCAVTKYNYHNDFAQYKHTGNTPVIAKKNADNIDLTKVSPRQIIKYSSRAVSHNRDTKNYKNWALQRSSFLEQVDVVKLFLTVPANSIAQLGSMVEIIINDAEAVKKTGIASLSGLWMISAIHHRIKQKTYFMDVELIRDSLK